MLTKAQQVRQYQDARIANMGRDIPRFEKFHPSYPVVGQAKAAPVREAEPIDLFEKYSPNQPRDNRGRFAPGGAGGVRARGGASGNPLLSPANAPTWWPTMARDLSIISLAAGSLGISAVVGLAGHGFARQMFRGLGPVAYRMGARTAASFVSTVHRMVRTLGIPIPRGAMRNIPRPAAAAAVAAAATAYSRMPKGAKKVVDGAVKTIRSARSKGRTVKPKRPTR